MSTLAFFPWLQVSSGLTVGNFELIPYDRGTYAGPDAAAVDAILRPYEEVPGLSVREATLLRVHPGALTDDLTETQVSEAFTFAQMLSFSGLSRRRFFEHAGYCNHDQLQLVVQHFDDPSRGVSVVTRRRDGSTTNLVLASVYRVPRPHHVHLGLVAIDVTLLAALHACQTHPNADEFIDAMLTFNMANTDSSAISPHVELVLSSGAFERVLGWTFIRYMHHLVELEVLERRRRRIERNQRQSELPADKTLATLKRSRLPVKVAKMLPTLCEGGFVERGDNLLAFGLPGRGKTHLVCAIGHELIHRGYRVLFVATYALVQRLLVAKRDLRLEDELQILDGFDAVVLDDIGYVQQNRDEMEVLFTFLAERYERRTVMITSNLVFSEWDRIFKDPMTTAAAIDRLVHHAVILEMTGSSIRIEEAQTGRNTEGGIERDHANTTTGATDNSIPGAAPTAPGPAATTTTPTTTTPTTTTERTSTTTTSPTTTTTPTDSNSIPGAAPTAPGPATSDQHNTKGEPTNDRTQQIKQRVQQRQSEADGEM